MVIALNNKQAFICKTAIKTLFKEKWNISNMPFPSCHYPAQKSSMTPHCLHYTVQTTEVTFKAFHKLTPSLLSCFWASLFCYIGPSLQSCWPIHYPANIHVSFPAECIPSLPYCPSSIYANATSSLKPVFYPVTRISGLFFSTRTDLHSCFPLL